MSVHTIIPFSDVLIEDIADTLNGNGGNVDRNNPKTFFTTGASINKWSRHKPVVYNSPAPLTDAQFKEVNYGIEYTPYWVRVWNMVNGFINGAADPENVERTPIDYWNYKLPSGGTSQPLRLSDFCKYAPAHNAPVGKCQSDKLSIDVYGTLPVGFNMNASNEYQLGLTDLNIMWSIGGGIYMKLSDMYLGICFYNGSKTYYYATRKISETPQMGVSFIFSNAPSALVGKWKVFCFASSIEIPDLVTTFNTAGVFAPLPDSLSEVTIAQAEVGLSVSCSAYYKSSISTIVNYSYTVKNADNNHYSTDSFVKVEIVNGLGNTLSSRNENPWTIDPYETKTVTGNIDSTIKRSVQTAALDEEEEGSGGIMTLSLSPSVSRGSSGSGSGSDSTIVANKNLSLRVSFTIQKRQFSAACNVAD